MIGIVNETSQGYLVVVCVIHDIAGSQVDLILVSLSLLFHKFFHRLFSRIYRNLNGLGYVLDEFVELLVFFRGKRLKVSALDKILDFFFLVL